MQYYNLSMSDANRTSRGFLKIECIKAIRAITGCMLKSAKDLADAAERGETVQFEFDEESYKLRDRYNSTTIDVQLNNIRSAGYEVVNVVDDVTASLVDLAKKCLDRGDYATVRRLMIALEKNDDVGVKYISAHC